MNFGDLPVGAKFKLWSRGQELVKHSATQYMPAGGGSAQIVRFEVPLMAAEAAPEAYTAAPADPTHLWGPASLFVAIQRQNAVVLDGTFEQWQLVSLFETLRRRKQP